MNTRLGLRMAAVSLASLLIARAALADNCSSFSDCFGTTRAAVAATVGVGVLAALVSLGLDLLPGMMSLGLDLLPGIGTIKGVLQAIEGKDLITGRELAWWERALGFMPVVGAVVGSEIAMMRLAGDVEQDVQGLRLSVDPELGEQVSSFLRGGEHVEATEDEIKWAAQQGTDVPEPGSRLRVVKKWIDQGGEVTYNPDGSTTYVSPEGYRVTYNKDLYPDFSDYLYKDGENTVRVPASDRKLDEATANRLAGYDETPEGYTWHHHESTDTMQLVETKVHDMFTHVGGFSIAKKASK